jgi:hypothetical protein
MIEGKALDDMVADIKAHGVGVICLYHERDGQRWFIDGRNRLRAAELAGVPFDKVSFDTMTSGTPVEWITRLNIHQRQLSKEAWADLIVKGIEAEEEAKRKADVAALEAAMAKPVDSQPVSEPVKHKGGKGRKSPIRQAAVAAGKAAGISESTIKTSLRNREAEKAGKPKPKRDRKPRLQSWGDDVEALANTIKKACSALPETFGSHTPEERASILHDLQQMPSSTPQSAH